MINRSKLKETVHIIGATTSFLLAVAALITAIKEPAAQKAAETTKAGYEEHQKAIVENQSAVAVTHGELEALRKYVKDQQTAHEAIVVPQPDAGAGRVVVLSVSSDAGPPKVEPLRPQAIPRPFNALP